MIDELITLSRQAGRAILRYYNEAIAVFPKDDDSPLTQADLASHYIIADGLKRLDDIPILSEESEIPDYQTRKSWTRYWLVDPLDGTKEFIKRNGEFTVNIALVENGVPILGVVDLPAKGVTYTGEKSQGSYRIDDLGLKERIYSVQPDISQPLAIVVSRSHADENLDQKLTKHNILIRKKIEAGSSLKFCLVAEGTVDMYPRFGTTMEWDTAAGDAVFRYSGKEEERISPLTYNKPNLKQGNFIIGL